jgi:hypothetical protein
MSKPTEACSEYVDERQRFPWFMRIDCELPIQNARESLFDFAEFN